MAAWCEQSELALADQVHGINVSFDQNDSLNLHWRGIGHWQIKTQYWIGFKGNSLGKEIKEEFANNSLLNILSTISNSLIVLNSSVNWIVYLAKDTK